MDFREQPSTDSGLREQQQLHTFFSTSLSVLQQSTSAGAQPWFTGTSRTLMECAEEREPQCALSRVTGHWAPLSAHSASAGSFPPEQRRTPRADSSQPPRAVRKSSMLRVNWLSPPTVPYLRGETGVRKEKCWQSSKSLFIYLFFPRA